MKQIKIFTGLLSLFVLLFTSCNKDVEQFPDITVPGPNPSPGLANALAANTNYSLYNAIIVKSGMGGTLNDSTKTMTMFVPSNAAVKQAIYALTAGQVPMNAPDAVFLGFINGASFTQATAAGIVGYNIVPQKIDFSKVSDSIPNTQYPSLLNPAPQISALLRLTTFLSRRNGNFVNNIPITSAAMNAGNGVMYETGALVAPPQKYLWDRINTDPELTYLKAAIARADEGAPQATSLTGYLQNIGANFTVFAPTDAAFKATLTGVVYQSLVAQGAPQGNATLAQAQGFVNAVGTGIFAHPAVSAVLTPTNVKGIVVYHILGSRTFLNNFPTTQKNYPTLLNTVVATHPGIGLTVTMTGPVAASATVKGAVNATPSNIIINAMPEPVGKSDQHYLNGVLHKIDQVLLPQAF